MPYYISILTLYEVINDNEEELHLIKLNLKKKNLPFWKKKSLKKQLEQCKTDQTELFEAFIKLIDKVPYSLILNLMQ